jgi:excisionase family DNA binding protein
MAKNDDVSEPICVSVSAAAKMLGVSRNTAYTMVKLKQLPTIRCGHRRLVVPLPALRKMLGEVGTAATINNEDAPR